MHIVQQVMPFDEEVDIAMFLANNSWNSWAAG